MGSKGGRDCGVGVESWGKKPALEVSDSRMGSVTGRAVASGVEA